MTLFDTLEMDKTKRSYFMPVKLVKLMDEECKRGGYIREAIVAASVPAFLEASPSQRQDMLERFHEFVTKRRR